MTKMMTIMEEITSKTTPASQPEVVRDLSQLDEQLVRNCLKQSLALYLLRNSKLPLCKVIDDIFDLEIEVGNFVANTLSTPGDKPTSLRGILANTLSVMPLGGDLREPVVNPSTNSVHAGI